MRRDITRSALACTLLACAVSAPAAEFETREAAIAALERYNRLIAAEPHFAVFHTLQGDAYYALNDLHAAVESYAAAIRLDDKQDEAYYGRGMALGRMGLVDEGIADLGIYIARHPDSSVAYTKRGVRNIWRNNLVEAERDLTRAIQLDPRNAEAHDDLGVVHAKHNRLQQAAHHFATAIRIDPSYQKAYHNLAISYHMTGQNQKALSVVDAGLQLDPDSRGTLLLKAAILQALGRPDEARTLEGRAEFLPETDWTERSDIGVTPTEEAAK